MPQSVRARKPRPKAKRKSSHAAEAKPEQGTDSPGRQSNGRFAQRNPGGPGNQHARFSAYMLTVARQTMTPEKMANLFEVIYAKALTGDMNAVKLCAFGASSQSAD